MRNSPNIESLATVALLVAGTIGGLAAFASKIALRELSPLSILLFRVTVMILVLLPFYVKELETLRKYMRQVGILGVLWAGNVTLFIIGIKYTTTIASQIIYALVPILVLVESTLLSSEKVTKWQAVGIGLGFVGALQLIFKPSAADAGLRSMVGNILIVIASVSWSPYLVASKRLSNRVSPVGLTLGSAIVAWCITMPMVLVSDGVNIVSSLMKMSSVGWFATLYIALGVGVAMILLYQWGLKHGSAITAGVISYWSTGVATVAGVVFLSEQITPRFVFGAVLVLLGIFLTSTLPLLTKSKNIQVNSS